MYKLPAGNAQTVECDDVPASGNNQVTLQSSIFVNCRAHSSKSLKVKLFLCLITYRHWPVYCRSWKRGGGGPGKGCVVRSKACHGTTEPSRDGMTRDGGLVPSRRFSGGQRLIPPIFRRASSRPAIISNISVLSRGHCHKPYFFPACENRIR